MSAARQALRLLLCLSLSGCLQSSRSISEHSMRTTYSDAWVTVSDDAPSATGVSAAGNKIPMGDGGNGNREYLFADSIRREKGKITALVEYRYAAPQILPANGRSYTHNHWLEQIDCQHGIRSILATTHYNAEGQIIDANEYAVPRYSAEDIKMLSKPDDPVIMEVCRRAAPAESGTEIANPDIPAAEPPARVPQHDTSAEVAAASAASGAASAAD